MENENFVPNVGRFVCTHSTMARLDSKLSNVYNVDGVDVAMEAEIN